MTPNVAAWVRSEAQRGESLPRTGLTTDGDYAQGLVGERCGMRWLGSLAIFVLVLVVLKFFFGWNISIIGSVVLTIILSVVFSLIDRARR